MIRKANSFKCEIQNSQQNEKNIFIFITKILFLLAESNSVQMKAPSIVRGRSKNVRQTMAREWDESECESCQNGNNIASIVVSFIYLCIYYGLLGNAKDRERERDNLSTPGHCTKHMNKKMNYSKIWLRVLFVGSQLGSSCCWFGVGLEYW